MTDPQPPAKPDADRKGGQLKLLIAAAVVAGILAVLGGIEAFNQLGRSNSASAPTLNQTEASPAEPADDAPAAEETPAGTAQPEAPVEAMEPKASEPIAEAPTPEPVVEQPTKAPVTQAAAATQAAPAAEVAETPIAPLETTTEAPAAETIVKPVETKPEPAVAETVTVDLAVTKAKGEPPSRSTGDVVWSANAYPSLSTQYAGTITFASGGTAAIAFNRSFVTTPPLTVDIVAKDGPLQGVAAIAVLRADGKDIAIDVGVDHATLADSGSFLTLLDATEIVLALLFENGDTGILTLAKPPGGGLEAVLFPDRPPGSEPSTPSQGQ